MLRTLLKPLALASVLALSAGMSAAAPVTLERQGSTIFNDNGSRSGTIIPGGSVAAGGFDVRVQAPGSLGIAHLGNTFTAWCLDIAHNLLLPSQYQVTTTPFADTPLSSQQRGDILRLFNTGYNASLLGTTAAGRNYSAGFQLALWEIVNETGTYNVNAGSFSATGFDGARTIANALLGNLGDTTPLGNWRLVFLQSVDGSDRNLTQDSQNLVTVAAVPLPAAGVLLLLALGGLGLAGRRRAA